VIHLGHVFMPMYLPIVALAFFVRPLPAAVTAAMTPLLSGAVLGMPPFYPPVALMMAVVAEGSGRGRRHITAHDRRRPAQGR
jgi:hypothetical protein